MQVATDFAGANIVVERLEADQVWVRQDLRDTAGDWFYWAFDLCGAAGRHVTVTFTGSNPLAALGPAMSLDGGATWCWLGAAAVDAQSFAVVVPPDCDRLRLAMTVPYVAADWQHFAAVHGLTRRVLCLSRGGRECDYVRLGCVDQEPRQRVLLTCRHHCCETMASYVLEGFLAAVVADPWWAAQAEVLAVPLVDTDGVEAGDQGKNRRPRDHNRDYDAAPVHPETRALQALVPDWSGGKLRVALDLHCPWIRGEWNEHIYFVGGREPANWRCVLRLAALLEAEQTGELPYAADRNLPFGQGWNTGGNYGDGVSFAAWAGRLPGISAATSLEFPYAVVDGVEVTPARARTFGGSLARAVQRLLH